jgi:hypothetical protein
LLPTITVNYVELRLTPSKLQLTTLIVGYASVVLFLFIFSPLILLPLVLLLCELLYDEGVIGANYHYKFQGNLRFTSQGEIDWHQHKAVILNAQILTRWLILFRVDHPHYHWILVWRDSVSSEQAYRQLVLFTYQYFAPR